MATVDGNVEALLIAGREFIPRIPAGQDPKLSQDDLGTPFVTADYDIGNALSVNNFAPQICYGLVVNYFPGDVSNGSGDLIWVNYGNETGGSSRVLIRAGQPIRFPRGARRVFLTSYASPGPNVVASVTWVIDRFATIGTPGPASLQQVKGYVATSADYVYNDFLDPTYTNQSGIGNGAALLQLSTSVLAGAPVDPNNPYATMFPGNANYLGIFVVNASDAAAQVNLYDAIVRNALGAPAGLMHSFTVGANATALSFVGPGMTNAGNNYSAILPSTIYVEKVAAGNSTPGARSVISVRGR